MSQGIEKEFRFWSLLRFALPTVIMMIFMSLYTIVDGIFIARFVGTDALSSTNIVYPVCNIVIAIAVMLASGGSAVVARKMGEGRNDEARQNFSLIVLVGVLVGILIAVLGNLFLEPLCRALGADDALLPDCMAYLSILLAFTPASMLQMLFNTFFVTASRPGLGLFLTVSAGVTNMVFDYIFIVPMDMGVAGAAYATAMGYLIPAGVGLVYFFLHKKGALHFAPPRMDGRMLLESCANGSSEMVTNISTAIITVLFNWMMLRYYGADGVAAITIVLYAQFVLIALFMGFSMGVAPVFSFNYGSGNTPQLKRLFRFCMIFITVSSVGIYLFSVFGAGGMVGIFSPPGTHVYEITIYGFLLFAISFLPSGVNIFASALFTALGSGTISALISFSRTFGFTLIGLLGLPLLWGVNGLWLAVPFAEGATLILSLFCLCRYGKKYRYL